MTQLPPFVKILPLLMVGIVLAEWVDTYWWVTALLAGGCSVGALVVGSRRIREAYGIVAIVLWGLCSAQLHRPQHTPAAQTIVEQTAVVTSSPYTNGGRWQRCDATLSLDDHDVKVLLRADTSIMISLGQQASASGFIAPLPEGSYGSLMARRGYYGTLYISHPDDWHLSDTISSFPIEARRIQLTLVERIHRLGLEADDEGVVCAMLLGSREGITPALRESYSLTGSSHLLAISGLHVGLVALVVWWLCWALPVVKRRGHLWRNVLAGVIMVMYAIISGLSPSVVRATLMFYTAQLAMAYGTPRQSVNILCGAGAVMLFANPNNLYDISFQLSMLAVVGIAIGNRPIAKWFGGNSPKRPLRWLVGVLSVSICSTIATLPLVAYTFDVVSLVGIFLGPIVILTAQIIVMSGIIWVSLPLEMLAPVAKWIIGGAASLQNMVVERAALLPMAAVEVKPPVAVVALCYALMVLGVIGATLWKEKRVWNSTNSK